MTEKEPYRIPRETGLTVEEEKLLMALRVWGKPDHEDDTERAEEDYVDPQFIEDLEDIIPPEDRQLMEDIEYIDNLPEPEGVDEEDVAEPYNSRETLSAPARAPETPKNDSANKDTRNTKEISDYEDDDDDDDFCRFAILEGFLGTSPDDENLDRLAKEFSPGDDDDKDEELDEDFDPEIHYFPFEKHDERDADERDADEHYEPDADELAKLGLNQDEIAKFTQELDKDEPVQHELDQEGNNDGNDDKGDRDLNDIFGMVSSERPETTHAQDPSEIDIPVEFYDEFVERGLLDTNKTPLHAYSDAQEDEDEGDEDQDDEHEGDEDEYDEDEYDEDEYDEDEDDEDEDDADEGFFDHDEDAVFYENMQKFEPPFHVRPLPPKPIPDDLFTIERAKELGLFGTVVKSNKDLKRPEVQDQMIDLWRQRENKDYKLIPAYSKAERQQIIDGLLDDLIEQQQEEEEARRKKLKAEEDIIGRFGDKLNAIRQSEIATIMSKLVEARRDGYGGLSGVQAFFAGGIAAAVAKTAVAPLEVVQTLMQIQVEPIKPRGVGYQGFFHAIGRIYAEDGIRGFYKGNLANCMRVFPHAAAKFVVFDHLCSWFTDHNGVLTVHQAQMRAGLLAGFAATMITYPLDTVRVRLMMDSLHPEKRIYRSVGDCFLRIGYREGLSTLWAGYVSSFWKVVAFQYGTFVSYHYMRELQKHRSQKHELSPQINFANGCFAAATSQFFAYPFETIQRRMQSQSIERGLKIYRYRHFRDAFRQIRKAEGLCGFYKGHVACLLKVAPSAGVGFMTWEFLKSSMLRFNNAIGISTSAPPASNNKQ